MSGFGRRLIRHRAVRSTAAAVLAVGLIVGIWQWIVTADHTPSYVACTPAQAFDAITQNWSTLAPLVWSTLRETAYGLLIGVGCGFAFAVVMSRSRLVEQLLYPILITSQAVPIIAVAPILVLIYSFTLTPILVVAALFVFFPVTINTLAGFRNVDPELRALARVLGAKRWRTFLRVELPSASTGLLSGLKISSVYAVSGVVLAQLFDTVSGDSLGFNQESALSSYRTSLVFGDTILMAAMGLFWFLVTVWIGYAVTPWRHRDTTPRWLRRGGGRTPHVD